MGKIEKLFEASTGLSSKLPDNGYELNIYTMGYKESESELKSKLTWKIPEVDGIPEKGVYLCKIDMNDFGWVYKTANVVKGEFRLCHNFTVIKPNYYRLIEEG